MTSATDLPAIDGGASPADDVGTARALLEQDPSAALQFVDARLPAKPDPRLFRIAAEACRRLGLAQDAEDAELAAIQAGFRLPQLNEAAVAAQDGRDEESRLLIDMFLEENPDDLLALTMAAERDIHGWNLERAEERLSIVLGRAPNFLRAIMLLAKYRGLQARVVEAIEILEQVTRRKPNNKTVLQYLAELYAEANDHEKAVELYAKVLALDPNDRAMWIIYAQQLRMLGRREESVAAFRKALALDPNSGAAW